MIAGATSMPAARAFSEGVYVTGRAVKDALSATHTGSASLDCAGPAGNAMPMCPDATHHFSFPAAAVAAEAGSPLMRRSVEDSASLLSLSKNCKAATTASALQASAGQKRHFISTLPAYVTQTPRVVFQGDAEAQLLVHLPRSLTTSPRGTAAAPANLSCDQPQPALAHALSPHPADVLPGPACTPPLRGLQATGGSETAATCRCSCLCSGVHADGGDPESVRADASKDAAAFGTGQAVRAGLVVDSSGRVSGLRRLRINASRNPQASPQLFTLHTPCRDAVPVRICLLSSSLCGTSIC